MYTYGPVLFDNFGKAFGVMRSDGAQVMKGDGIGTDWKAFLTWNSAQPVPLSLADRAPGGTSPRTLLAIYNDLNVLTVTQKNNIWNNLSAGTPKLYQTDKGTNAGAIGTLDFLLGQTTANWNATDLISLKMRITMNYVQDNPSYLVHPTFDSTINVPGVA